MNHFRTAIYSALIAAVLGLGACSMMQMMSGSSAMTGRLSAASEAPPVPGNASGTLDANLNKRTNMLSWTVTYSGLSGPVTGAHFHGPAMAGQNAGVAVPITGSLASPIKGDATLTAAQVAELMAGRWYLNLHTAVHPNGEIRAQVDSQP